MTESTRSTVTTHPHRRTDAPGQRPGLALAIVLTCQLMLVLDVTVMNVALPRIQAGLRFSTADLSWVINAYTLAFGGLLLLGGRIGDLLGRRRMFVLGVAVFTVASLAGGLAQSASWLLVARVVQGLGGALAGPSTIALLTSTVTDARARVRALALFSAMASAGFAIGLVLGGLLTEWLSWRWVLFINVPFGAAVALLAPRFVREPQRHPGRLDLPGAVTATAGVGALVYAFIRAAASGWADGLVVGALVGGVVLLAGFVLIEARTAQPLLPLRLLADRNRAAAYLNFFLGPMAMLAMFFFLTQFLQEVDRFGPLATGFAFLPMPAVLFGVTRVMPWLLARFGPKALTMTGSALMLLGLLWLSRVNAGSGYVDSLLGPLVVMGFGAGIGFTPLNVIIMSTVPARDAGTAGGMLQTAQQLGGTLGLAVLVTVFGATARHAGSGASQNQVLVTGMSSAFTVAAGFALCAVLVAATFRGRARGGIEGR